MRTDRPYRKALPQEDAIGELLTCAGGQFDPAIIRALLEVVDPAAAERLVEPAPAIEDDGLDLLALDASRVLDSGPTRTPRA
jgi:HD-GYP domain-containing protein (c-di-GMP phosphodiesterase class II)